MSTSAASAAMTVRLREATVALLMAQRIDERETLDAVVTRLAKTAGSLAAMKSEPPQTAPRLSSSTRRSRDGDGKYALVMLGDTLRAGTLGETFAKVVDGLAAVDPAAVERLAAMRSRKRAFVASDPEVVHPGRTDLPVLRAASGWWVSANIGTADIKRALRALCEVAGLSYGRDIRFVGRSEPRPEKHDFSASANP